MKRILILALSLALVSSTASAYYYFLYYTGRSGSPGPVPVRFDLSALPNNTILFFISDQGPGTLATGDTLPAVVSQIRLAARAWNDVETSDLRVRFGGFASAGTVQTTPGIDVVFDDDLPEGILGQTLPMTPADVSFLANGAAFVPLLRSRIQIRRDLSKQPSFNEDFFLTLVHEFGHALGLQHSLTASVMSTSVTRATRKAKPLAADDIAGISLLYPARSFAAQTGSLTGHVTLSGSGVNMASVVALSTTGVAINTLTNVDGSYRLDGVPPGQYLVYAHPLPPALQGESRPANIDPPRDAQQNSFPATSGFDAQFFPGTKDWTQAAQVSVSAGATVDNVSFAMQRRSGPPTHSVTLYGYLGPAQVPVQAPPIPAGSRVSVVFTGPGLVSNGQMAQGLNVTVIGGAAQIIPGTLRVYDPPYLVVGIETAAGAVDGPVALSMILNGDLYVLPVAFTVVTKQPPAVSSLSGPILDDSGNRIVTVTGTNLSADSRILFDGAPGTVLRVNPDGSLAVAAPPASGQYTARVVALNPDGQSSALTLGSATPPVFSYDSPDNPSVNIWPNQVPAGVDAMVEIVGFNTNFGEGQTVVGFGLSDVVVRRLWVVSPSRLLANISVSSTAAPGLTRLTVATGLQMVAQPQAFQILEPRGQTTMRVPVTNAVTGLAGVPAGGTAAIGVPGMPQILAGWSMTIGEQQATIVGGPNGQILAQVPTGLLPGPAVVKLYLPSGDPVFPIAMQVDSPPPVILGATNAAGAIDPAHPARAGDTIAMTVLGLTDRASVEAASLSISVGGVDHAATSVTSTAQPGTWQVQFVLSPSAPYGPETPTTVGVDTRISAPYPLAIRLP